MNRFVLVVCGDCQDVCVFDLENATSQLALLCAVSEHKNCKNKAVLDLGLKEVKERFQRVINAVKEANGV